MTAWRPVAEALHDELRVAGFDLWGATTTGRYHAELSAAERASLGLPDFGRDDRLVVCVGNTRALWAPLRAAAQEDPPLLAEDHPLDRYAARVVAVAAASVATRAQVAYATRLAAATGATGAASVAIVRLAVLAGLGQVGPTRLLIHPEHGPWVGLRAAVVFDIRGPGPETGEPGESGEPGETGEPRPVAAACDRCLARPCVPPFERAVEASGGPRAVTEATLARDFDLWVASRRACPVGAGSRYDDAQAEYHYTKRKALLAPGGGSPSG